MANGALDSYLQVQLNVFDIPNILLENGWVDNKIQTINFQNKSIKKMEIFGLCGQFCMRFAGKKNCCRYGNVANSKK